MADIPQSVASHWDVLWYLLVAIVGAAFVELRIFLYSMKRDQKDFVRAHNECQNNLPNVYAKITALDDLEEKFEHHYHEGRPAKVVINGRGL